MTEESKSKSLAEAILDEQKRCHELLTEYAKLGPAGQFGHFMISLSLLRTEKAVMEGDTVAMLRCYEELKECE